MNQSPYFQAITLSHNNQLLSIGYLKDSNFAQWARTEAEHHPTPWSENHLKDSLKNHHCIGLWSESELIGYAVFSFVVGEAELLLFVLHKNWRGKGLAAKFLRELLGALKPRVRSVFLEVRESNLSALYLYEACGFNQIGRRSGYYPGKHGREDALIYALELNS